ATQAKLLRVLQNQEVQRVGSLSTRKVDLRVIAATNHDLRAAIAEKRFREDLYYRLSMVEIRMPRLEERKEDLPLLERHFVTRFAAQYKKEIRGLSHRARIALAMHGWPGNVRELENVLGHACMMAESEFIDLREPPEYVRDGVRGISPSDLERLGGNRLQAAQVLGISRATLSRILRPGNPEPGAHLIEVLGPRVAGPRL